MPVHSLTHVVTNSCSISLEHLLASMSPLILSTMHLNANRTRHGSVDHITLSCLLAQLISLTCYHCHSNNSAEHSRGRVYSKRTISVVFIHSQSSISKVYHSEY